MWNRKWKKNLRIGPHIFLFFHFPATQHLTHMICHFPKQMLTLSPSWVLLLGQNEKPVCQTVFTKTTWGKISNKGFVEVQLLLLTELLSFNNCVELFTAFIIWERCLPSVNILIFTTTASYQLSHKKSHAPPPRLQSLESRLDCSIEGIQRRLCI